MPDPSVRGAVEVVHGQLLAGGIDSRGLATEIVAELKRAGLLARCTCPVGFGQVRDLACPAHGERSPAHTIVGAA